MTTLGFETYRTHLALNLHFNPKVKYDFFKYNGQVNLKDEAVFLKSRFHWQYAGLEKKLNKLKVKSLLPWFLLYWEHDFKYVGASPKFFKDMFRLHESKPQDDFQSKLKQDFKLLSETDLQKRTNSHYPEPYTLYLVDKITWPTLLIYDTYIDTVLLPSQSTDPIGWPKVIELTNLTRSFVPNIISESELNMLLDEAVD